MYLKTQGTQHNASWKIFSSTNSTAPLTLFVESSTCHCPNTVIRAKMTATSHKQPIRSGERKGLRCSVTNSAGPQHAQREHPTVAAQRYKCKGGIQDYVTPLKTNFWQILLCIFSHDKKKTFRRKRSFQSFKAGSNLALSVGSFSTNSRGTHKEQRKMSQQLGLCFLRSESQPIKGEPAPERDTAEGGQQLNGGRGMKGHILSWARCVPFFLSNYSFKVIPEYLCNHSKKHKQNSRSSRTATLSKRNQGPKGIKHSLRVSDLELSKLCHWLGSHKPKIVTVSMALLLQAVSSYIFWLRAFHHPPNSTTARTLTAQWKRNEQNPFRIPSHPTRKPEIWLLCWETLSLQANIKLPITYRNDET